jgi:hypothetical protein
MRFEPRRSGLEPGLLDLVRFAAVAVYLFADDTDCDLIKIPPQLGTVFLEPRPHDLIDKLLRDTECHFRGSLAMEALWPQTMPSGQREEQLAGPLIRQGGLHLDGSIAALEFRRSGAEPFKASFGGGLLPWRARAGEQSLELAQLCAQGRRPARPADRCRSFVP